MINMYLIIVLTQRWIIYIFVFYDTIVITIVIKINYISIFAKLNSAVGYKQINYKYSKNKLSIHIEQNDLFDNYNEMETMLRIRNCIWTLMNFDFFSNKNYEITIKIINETTNILILKNSTNSIFSNFFSKINGK